MGDGIDKTVVFLMAMLVIVLGLIVFLVEKADAHNHCGASVSTTAKAHHRAQRGWDSEQVKKRPEQIERVRRQARCVPDGKPQAFVRGQIKTARKQYKKAKKAERLDRLYDRLTAVPGQAWLAATRMCESGNRYHLTYGAYGMIQGWAYTHSAYVRSGWPEPPASTPPAGSNEQQDIRASLLYQMEGGSPWPNCP